MGGARHDSGRVSLLLLERGLKVGTGTIVDATIRITIIGAPSSTKNADKARDP